MLLTAQEASEVLTKRLKEEFGDKDGKVDVLKAAAVIFDNPPFQHEIKAVQDIVDYPCSGIHHYRIWEWAGMRLTRAFKVLD